LKAYEQQLLKAKCLHYATGFPVCVRAEGKPVYALPEKQASAAELTGNAVLGCVPAEAEKSAQYLLSPAGERYISLKPEEGVFVTLGPMLTEPITDGSIAQLIRSGLVKMRSRRELRQYYDSLAIVPVEKYYYAGKLMEMLFTETAGEHMPAAHTDDVPGFIPDAYYAQTATYRTRQFLHSPYVMEQEISHYIANGDTEGALRILAEINARPKAQLAGTELRSVKNSVICSCAFMTRAAISGGVRADDAFTLSDAFIRQIESQSNIRSVLEFEQKMVAGFSSAVRNKKLGSYSPAVSGTIGYIEDHLCEKLTLEGIADAVYLNPNYLSGLFKDELGMSMHGYIVKRRIEEAAYFVRAGNEPLADIASFFQFSSQSHFVQCFKRVLGVTPGEYRKNGNAPGPQRVRE